MMLRTFLPLLLLVACATPKDLDPRKNESSKRGVLSLSGYSFAEDETSFQVGMRVQNLSADPALIKVEDIACFRAGEKGKFSHTMLDIGDRLIDLKGGEFKNYNFRCKGVPPGGTTLKIHVKRVYKNPSGDGKTPGKVLGENVEWIHRKDLQIESAR